MNFVGSNNLGKIEGLHHQVKSYIVSIILDSSGNKCSPQRRQAFQERFNFQFCLFLIHLKSVFNIAIFIVISHSHYLNHFLRNNELTIKSIAKLWKFCSKSRIKCHGNNISNIDILFIVSNKMFVNTKCFQKVLS